ncbi:MAG: DUF4276 family protein [Candidatus Delongbacteria bacterium]|nr:DUF4276 family protein [Candidatus Delongbacteria bacterium]
MSSIDIFVVVEGSTEQLFIKDVLAPYLVIKDIYVYPTLIGKPGHKGGDIRYDRAKEDIFRFLKQRKDTYISTMFDFFRIDADWPGMNDIRNKKKSGIKLTSEEKAAILEEATHKMILKEIPKTNAKNRFIPYFEMHEFEALLFSDTNVIAEKTGIAKTELEKIIKQYKHPEDINEDPKNAPSKQLLKLKSDYKKVNTGKVIAEAIGINKIRKKCPHFDQWLKKLENLKS